MILGAAQLFFIFFIVLLLSVWLLTRRYKVALPSDFFVIAFVTVFTPAIILNPEGLSSFAEQTYDASVAAQGIILISFSVAFFILGLTAGLVPASMFYGANSNPAILDKRESDGYNSKLLKFSACALCVFFVGGVLEYAEAIDLVRYLTGQLDNDEYSSLRRFEHVGGNPIDVFAERFRYSLVALPLLIVTSYLIFSKRTLTALILYSFCFVIFAGGLSKQMVSLFIVYFLGLLAVRYYPALFTAKKLIIVPLVFPVVLLAALTPLYLLQYPDVFHDSFLFALEAAFYRVFVVPYTDVLTYLEVYPSRHPFTGILSSSLISAVFHLEFRDILTEVAIFHFGSDRHTTVTTAYFASAWAMGGYLSVAIQAFTVGFYLRILDVIIVSTRDFLLRISVFMLMIVNCILWLQVPLLTGAFSYGLAVIPLIAFLVELLSKKSTQLNDFNRLRRP